MKQPMLTWFAAAVACLVSASAWADGLGPLEPPRFIPYEGTLEQDGSLVSGARELSFQLFDGEGGEALSVWQGQQTVQVSAGTFSVLLGPLDEAVFFSDALFLSVAVITDDGPVPLSSRQRIVPTPFSYIAGNLPGDVITGAHIADGSIADGDIAPDAAIDIDKVALPSGCQEGDYLVIEGGAIRCTRPPDYHYVPSATGTISGLEPGRWYMVWLYGVTHNRGTGSSVLWEPLVQSCQTDVALMAWPRGNWGIDWHDGSAPQSGTFFVQAPADGCVETFMDCCTSKAWALGMPANFTVTQPE